MSLPSIHEMFPGMCQFTVFPSPTSLIFANLDHLLNSGKPQTVRFVINNFRVFIIPSQSSSRTTASVCSIPGCECATASSSNSPGHSIPQSAFSSAPLITSGDSIDKWKSRSQKSSPYSYNLLRSDPTSGSLKHIASNEHGPLFRGHTRHVPPNIKVPHPSPVPQNHPSSIPQSSTRSRQPHSDSHSDSKRPYLNDYPEQDNSFLSLIPKGLADRVSTRSRDTGIEYPYPPHCLYSRQDVEQYGDDGLASDEYHDKRDATVDDHRALSNRVSTFDTMGRKHVCPTCFKRFNRPSSLRIHVNTHTGATRKC